MALSATVIRRVIAASAVTAAVTIAPILSAIAQTVSLTGAGATFPVPLYDKYINEFKKENPGINVSYQGIGSGAGIRQVIAEVVQFGGSDAAMTDAEIAKVPSSRGGIILVPTAGGAVSVVYNLPGVSNLKLSKAVLPEIFAGRITRWNDGRIAKDNPGVNLPNSEIKTVVRADGSGTTFIFTNHLSAINPYFKGRVGVGTAPKWTTNSIKGRGNPGVAQQVSRTEGSIGYVEYAYADQNKLQMASVQNKKGEFVAPSLDSANAALKSVRLPENNRIFIGDPEDGYPIVGLTWMMIYKQYPKPEEAAAIKKWVGWVLTKGQDLNDDLKYTSIPQSDRQRIIDTVNREVK
ncbi:MAG TPA: phosphate ABC transporter substrate-binding protein PstS [Thermosynechococcaceae cyanobacterium]